MELFTGVLGDPRDDSRVQNGWSINEILPSSATLNWRKKLPITYPVWNQAGTSACVAFSKARQLSIKIYQLTDVWIDFSPASIYQLRINSPGEGMHIPDANEIVNKRGATLEALMKSQHLTEAQINTVKRSKVADLFANAMAEAVVSYLYVPIDIDRIAQTIEAEKVVSLLIFATFDEYARKVPIIINPNLTYGEALIRHEIVAVDYFLDENGVKKIHVNDSAHFGGFSTRDFTQEFLEKRCVLADALDVFSFDTETNKKLMYIPNDTVSLQDCLKDYGTFPLGQPSTGIYGPITQKAVSDFQVKEGLHPTGTGTVGPLTTARLKILYP